MKTNYLNSIPEEIIIRYLSDEANDADISMLLSWIKESDENKKHFLEIRDTFISLDIHHSNEAFNIDEAYNNFIQHTSTAQPAKQRNIYLFLLGRVAAVLILALASYYFFTYQAPIKTKTIASTNTCLFDTLTDGSIISLNQKSIITYPETFANNKREVSLKGEAFFNVSKNKQKPFIININDFHVKVVGTSFNVKAYPSDELVIVTIETGRVLCYYGNDEKSIHEIVLNPGEQGIFDKKTFKLTKIVTTNFNYNTWATGQLIFKNSSMYDVLKEVENNFKVHFIVQDTSVYKCQLTAKINTQSRTDLFSILETALNIKITPKENNILISGKGCE